MYTQLKHKTGIEYTLTVPVSTAGPAIGAHAEADGSGHTAIAIAGIAITGMLVGVEH